MDLMSRGFKNSELSRIQNFETFPDPKIRNFSETINSGFYRRHKLGILWSGMQENLTETKIHKKTGCADPKAKKLTYLD